MAMIFRQPGKTGIGIKADDSACLEKGKICHSSSNERKIKMKLNSVIFCLCAGLCSSALIENAFSMDNETRNKTCKLDSYRAMIASKYFDNIQDFANLEKVNSKYKETRKKFHCNTISIKPEDLKSYPNLQTLHLYTREDIENWAAYEPDEKFIDQLPSGNLKDAKGLFYKVEIHVPYDMKEIKRANLLDSMKNRFIFIPKEDDENKNVAKYPIRFRNVTVDSRDFADIGHVDPKTGQFIFNDDVYTGYKKNKEISIGESDNSYVIRNIPHHCFSRLKSLKSILIPNSVESIGESAFEGCTSLENVTIPDSVTSIRSDAFSSCSSLRDVKLPSSLRYIGMCAFDECDKLDKISVTASVTALHGDFVCGLNHCTVVVPYKAMKSALLYEESGPGLALVKNITVNIDEKAGDCDYKIWWPDDGRLIIPGNEQEGFEKSPIITGYNGDVIYDSMFEGRTDLIDVTIGEGVKSIGKYSFAGCRQLKHVVIPKSVLSIGEFAFISCKDLSYVEILDDVQYIGSGAFCGTDIDAFVVPDSVTSIEEGVFLRCNKLASITIHDNVKSIGERAFMECVELIDVDLKKVTKIGSRAFEGCKQLKSITISKDVQEIDRDAFNRCTALENIFIKCSDGNVSKKMATKITYMVRRGSGNTRNIHFIDADGKEIRPTDE